MTTATETIEELVSREYSAGFVTDVEQDIFPPGLDEGVVRAISARKHEPEWLLQWRLKALRQWTGMVEPRWAKVDYPAIDYQAISYFAAPKSSKDGPQSLAEVDPEILATYEKLGIPLHERAALAGVAVDAVFDSVSVATTFKDRLTAVGVIFLPLSEAVQQHPELVRRYLGSVVPASDNFFAALNAAVFSDGSFVYVPKGCPLPNGAVDLLPNQRPINTGQFERTLIIADEGSLRSPTSRVAPHRCATRTSCMPRSSS